MLSLNHLKLNRNSFVSLVQNSKVGKIRSESGAWIPASYKTNRYTQWKEKSKVDSLNDDNDDEDESPQMQKCKFSNNFSLK